MYSLLITCLLTSYVEDMGNVKWTVREEASAKLDKIGEPALPILAKALSHKDMEIRCRATRLLNNIVSKKIIAATVVITANHPGICIETCGTVVASGKKSLILTTNSNSFTSDHCVVTIVSGKETNQTRVIKITNELVLLEVDKRLPCIPLASEAIYGNSLLCNLVGLRAGVDRVACVSPCTLIKEEHIENTLLEYGDVGVGIFAVRNGRIMMTGMMGGWDEHAKPYSIGWKKLSEMLQ